MVVVIFTYKRVFGHVFPNVVETRIGGFLPSWVYREFSTYLFDDMHVNYLYVHCLVRSRYFLYLKLMCLGGPTPQCRSLLRLEFSVSALQQLGSRHPSASHTGGSPSHSLQNYPRLRTLVIEHRIRHRTDTTTDLFSTGHNIESGRG